MPIIQLLAANGFDDETATHLGAAFDAAWQTLVSERSPYATTENAPAARELLARRIISTGLRGVTDPVRLMDDALWYL